MPLNFLSGDNTSQLKKIRDNIPEDDIPTTKNTRNKHIEVVKVNKSTKQSTNKSIDLSGIEFVVQKCNNSISDLNSKLNQIISEFKDDSNKSKQDIANFINDINSFKSLITNFEILVSSSVSNSVFNELKTQLFNSIDNLKNKLDDHANSINLIKENHIKVNDDNIHTKSITNNFINELNNLKNELNNIVRSQLSSLRSEIEHIKNSANNQLVPLKSEIENLKNSANNQFASIKSEVEILKNNLKKNLDNSNNHEHILRKVESVDLEVNKFKNDIDNIKNKGFQHKDDAIFLMLRDVKQEIEDVRNNISNQKISKSIDNNDDIHSLKDKGFRDDDGVFLMLRDVKQEIEDLRNNSTHRSNPKMIKFSPGQDVTIDDLRLRLEQIESLFQYDENGGFLKIGPECNIPKQNDPEGKAGVWKEAPTSLLVSGGVVLNNFGYREKREKKHKLLCIDNTTGKLYLVQNE